MNDQTSPSPPGILKAPTGITGFDLLTGGGLPRGRTTLVLGPAGSGKTIFALQTLVNGARLRHEPGIFVAFEENSRQIIANAASFGWDLPALEQEKLFFLDARLPLDSVKSGGFDLAGLLARLAARAAEMGAKRIVFDSIGVLLESLDDRLAERQELYRVHDWLAQSELTGLVTDRIEGYDPPATRRYGFLQFMADCVVVLQHRLAERISLRDVRVMKYRGSSFAENEFPLVIGQAGLEVANFGPSDLDYPVSAVRVSSGIERLDTMLNGGYYQGSSVLITGSPGTAKSTLCGAFIEAACRRGERALYVSFDEAGSEIVRNLASVNIQLEPHRQSGRLRTYAARTESRSAEEHLLKLKNLIDEHQPACIVVDPLSAMLKAGGQGPALNVATRLLHLTKAAGITLVCTSLLTDADPAAEQSPMQISTVADTWLHLSYIVQGGERNRALTIVKSRGTRHSNQVRELVLSDDGVTLTDVYVAGGEVLMGTLRWEKELAEQRERSRRGQEVERRRRELELVESETRARIEALQRELAAQQADLARLNGHEADRQTGLTDQHQGLLHRRGADREPGNARPEVERGE